MKDATIRAAGGQLPRGRVPGHGAHRATMERQIMEQREISQAPQPHMPVAVTRDHECGGLIRDHVGDRRGRGEALEQLAVARPAREHAVVSGGQDFAVVVEKLQSLERAVMRRPAAERLSFRQAPQAYTSLRTARSECLRFAVEGERIAVVVGVMQDDIGGNARLGSASGQRQSGYHQHHTGKPPSARRRIAATAASWKNHIY